MVLLPLWIVGSLWLSRARENAMLIAPDRVRRSAVWAWLGWWVPIVGLWFPKQIVDDSWRITSSVAAVGPRGRYRDTSLWWVLWIAYNVAGNAYANRVFLDGIMGNDVPVHQGVVPALETSRRCLASWPSPPGCPWSEGCPRLKPNWPGRTGLLAWVEAPNGPGAQNFDLVSNRSELRRSCLTRVGTFTRSG